VIPHLNAVRCNASTPLGQCTDDKTCGRKRTAFNADLRFIHTFACRRLSALLTMLVAVATPRSAEIRFLALTAACPLRQPEDVPDRSRLNTIAVS